MSFISKTISAQYFVHYNIPVPGNEPKCVFRNDTFNKTVQTSALNYKMKILYLEKFR
jgi:hypothetical protein